MFNYIHLWFFRRNNRDLARIVGLRGWETAIIGMEMTCFVNGIKIAMPYHELKYEALTKRIIGCAMKVHRYLGHGFPEIIYHRALKIELEKEKLKNLSEVARDIY